MAPPPRLGLQEEWLQKSREQVFQVTGVDAPAGQITVAPMGALHDGYTVDIPVGALVIDGQRSSWQRYMPQKNEYVTVWWDQANQPHAGRSLSYIEGHDAGFLAAVANTQVLGLNEIFRQLKPGEFDLRSSGGAGYWFSAQGHAKFHSGGLPALDLDARRNESVAEAGLFVTRGDGCEQRLGDVKRALPPPGLPFELSFPPAKEWSVTVGQALSPALALTYFDQIAGDARDSFGIPVVGSPFPFGTATPLRYRQRVFDPAGISPVHSVEVDAAGNVSHISSVGSLALCSSLPAGGVWLGSRAALFGVALGEPIIKALQVFATAVETGAGLFTTTPGPPEPKAVAGGGALVAAATALLATLNLPGLVSLKVRCDS